MNTKERYDAICDAMTTKERGNDTIYVYREDLNEDVRDELMRIQRESGNSFEISYDIMASACAIINDKTLDGSGRDSLIDEDMLDLYADADGTASVYTSTRLEYLSPNNESEISDLMADESITSIAEACAIWYERQVESYARQLRDYILAGDDNDDEK
jgi:hypothetical protein